MQINKHTTTAYHSQANGVVERANSTFQTMTRLYVNETHEDWDLYIPPLCFAHNTSFTTSINESPYYLMYGHDPRLPIDLLLDTPQLEYANLSDYARQLTDRLRQAYTAAAKALETTAKTRAERQATNAKTGQLDFEHGDRVWPFCKINKKGVSRKLHKHWNGPYRIIKKVGDTVYAILPTDGSTTREMLAHASRLKAYMDRRLLTPHLPPHDSFADDLRHAINTSDLPELPALRGTLWFQPAATYDRRKPTPEEKSLEHKAFRDTNDGHVYRVYKVAYNNDHQVVVGYYKRLRQKRDGTYVEEKARITHYSTVDELAE